MHHHKVKRKCFWFICGDGYHQKWYLCPCSTGDWQMYYFFLKAQSSVHAYCIPVFFNSEKVSHWRRRRRKRRRRRQRRQRGKMDLVSDTRLLAAATWFLQHQIKNKNHPQLHHMVWTTCCLSFLTAKVSFFKTEEA